MGTLNAEGQVKDPTVAAEIDTPETPVPTCP